MNKKYFVKNEKRKKGEKNARENVCQGLRRKINVPRTSERNIFSTPCRIKPKFSSLSYSVNNDLLFKTQCGSIHEHMPMSIEVDNNVKSKPEKYKSTRTAITKGS